MPAPAHPARRAGPPPSSGAHQGLGQLRLAGQKAWGVGRPCSPSLSPPLPGKDFPVKRRFQGSWERASKDESTRDVPASAAPGAAPDAMGLPRSVIPGSMCAAGVSLRLPPIFRSNFGPIRPVHEMSHHQGSEPCDPSWSPACSQAMLGCARYDPILILADSPPSLKPRGSREAAQPAPCALGGRAPAPRRPQARRPGRGRGEPRVARPAGVASRMTSNAHRRLLRDFKKLTADSPEGSRPGSQLYVYNASRVHTCWDDAY